jgi:hypothetical protein
MVSTPNAPEGLFQKIEQEPEEKYIYKRIFSGLYIRISQNLHKGTKKAK